jgi:hypothetical protein
MMAVVGVTVNWVGAHILHRNGEEFIMVDISLAGIRFGTGTKFGRSMDSKLNNLLKRFEMSIAVLLIERHQWQGSLMGGMTLI